MLLIHLLLHNLQLDRPPGPLKLERPLVCFDIESTGLNVSRDRVLEIAAVKVWPGGKVGCCCWTPHLISAGSAGHINCNRHSLAASSSSEKQLSEFSVDSVPSAAEAAAADTAGDSVYYWPSASAAAVGARHAYPEALFVVNVKLYQCMQTDLRPPQGRTGF